MKERRGEEITRNKKKNEINVEERSKGGRKIRKEKKMRSEEEKCDNKMYENKEQRKK